MKKAEEEKNKVGRPKLADEELKKKSFITIAIALVCTLALVIGGAFQLFGGQNTINLKGSSNCVDKYKRELSMKYVKGCPSGYSLRANRECIKYVKEKKTCNYSVKDGKKTGSCPSGSKCSSVSARGYTAYTCTYYKDVPHSTGTILRKYYYYKNCKSGYTSGSGGICYKYVKCGGSGGGTTTKPNPVTTTGGSGGGGGYYPTPTYAATTTTKPKGSCTVTATASNKVTYKISCTHDAKVQSAYMVLSNKTYTLAEKINKKEYKNTWNPDYYSSFRRGGYVYIKYTDGVTSKEQTARTKGLFKVDTRTEYKKVCTDNSTTCKEPYHIDPTNSYCRTFVYNVGTTQGKFAIRCDAQATPWRIEVVDTKENQIEKAVDGKDYDLNWKNNYGYRVSDRELKNLKNGTSYKLRITYLFIDDDKNGKSVVRMTRSDTPFTVGKTNKENNLSEQIKGTRFEKMNANYGKKFTDGECTISATGGSKQIKYSFKCANNARPVSLRLTTAKDHKSWERYYNKSIKTTYKATYTNGEVLDNTINQSGTIRNAFGTEAQTKKNAASYGMSEDGTISGIEAGKYRLQLYYNYRNPQTKKQITYILTTTGDTDIVVK